MSAYRTAGGVFDIRAAGPQGRLGVDRCRRGDPHGNDRVDGDDARDSLDLTKSLVQDRAEPSSAVAHRPHPMGVQSGTRGPNSSASNVAHIPAARPRPSARIRRPNHEQVSTSTTVTNSRTEGATHTPIMIDRAPTPTN